MKFAKTEALFILLLFAGVILWMVSKCSARRAEMSMRHRSQTELPQQYESPASLRPKPAPQPAPQPVPTATPTAAAPQPTAQAEPQSASTATAPQPAPKAARPSLNEQAARTEGLTRLYVTLDNLNVRKTPTKNGALVTRLKLYDEVFFLNEKSPEKETVNLGAETVSDHWIKIRTANGKEGWVFGAGVHYFKTKREAPK
ncbi:MAG: SH3 domain-containing protein [Saprospiraceae bacterium]